MLTKMRITHVRIEILLELHNKAITVLTKISALNIVKYNFVNCVLGNLNK